MAYEATSVPVSRSQEAIRKLLLENGASGVAFVSQTDPLQEGFQAMIPLDGKTYQVRIVAKVKTVERKARHRRYGYAPKSQVEMQEGENRRVWRVLYYHLKSVYEAANTGVMEFRELMLPYVVVKDGRTIAEHLIPQLDKAIESRPERLLMGAS